MDISRTLLVVLVAVHTLCVGYLRQLHPTHVPPTRSSTVVAQVEAPVTPTTKKIIRGAPTQIYIGALGIQVAVAPGVYNKSDGTWSINDSDAFFATLSAPVNDAAGNTLIYGHNNWAVFGKLPDMVPGDTAVVTTSAGDIFEYSYTSTSTVGPEDTSILHYRGPPQLTLQTCTGSFDQNRTFWHFQLTKVTPAPDPVADARQAKIDAIKHTVSTETRFAIPTPSILQQQA